MILDTWKAAWRTAVSYTHLDVYKRQIDDRVIEAARDLGANNFQVFRYIILPLSVPGIVSGVTMVFVPALTTFVISNMLGGGKILLIGNVIEQEFTVGNNLYLIHIYRILGCLTA